MISGRAGVVTRPPRKAGARRPGTGPTRGARRDARDDAGRKREGWRTWQAGSEEGSAPSRLNLDGSRALRAFHRRWPTSVAAAPHPFGCARAHFANGVSGIPNSPGRLSPLGGPIQRRSDPTGCCAVVVVDPARRDRPVRIGPAPRLLGGARAGGSEIHDGPRSGPSTQRGRASERRSRRQDAMRRAAGASSRVVCAEGVQRIDRSTARMSRWPHRAIVVSSSVRMISRERATPA